MTSPRTKREIDQAVNQVCVIAAGSRRGFPTDLLEACLTRDGDYAVLDDLALNVAILLLAVADVAETSTDAIIKETASVDVGGPCHVLNDLAHAAAIDIAQTRIDRHPVNISVRGSIPAVEVALALVCLLVQTQILFFVHLKDAYQAPSGLAADTGATPASPVSSEGHTHGKAANR